MKKELIKISLLYICLYCFLVSICNASVESKNIERSIYEATEIRIKLSEMHTHDINSPGSIYSDKLLKIANELNKSWWNQQNSAFSNYLFELWQKTATFIPTESWEEVNNPIVRIEIANLLGQSIRSNLLKMDIKELREYVCQFIDSENIRVRTSAVLALGYVGNSDDIVLLERIVLEEQESLSEYAILSMTVIPNNLAIDKIKELEGKVKRKSLKEFINTRLSGYN